jgi:hypothetical protein
VNHLFGPVDIAGSVFWADCVLYVTVQVVSLAEISTLLQQHFVLLPPSAPEPEL